jgi:Protein of unknown function (DUF2934)
MAKPKKRQDDRPSPEHSLESHGIDDGNGNFADRVAVRAYELYLARGGTDGQAWDDWLAAERELAAPPGESRR